MISTKLNKNIFWILTLSCFFGFNSAVNAANISKMKGAKVLILMDGSNFTEGEELYALNSNGKKSAIIKITQVKGEKAIGEITKGKAEEGFSVIPKSASAAGGTKTAATESDHTDSESADSGSNKTFARRKKMAGGVLVGYSMNSMSLTAQYQPSASSALRSASTDLKGSSFSIKGFGDYDIMPEVTIRGSIGLEPFDAKGDATTSSGQNICGDGASSSCTVSFNYISFEGSIHYNFLTGKNRVWVGAGYAFMFTASKSLNIPNLQTSGSTNQMMLASVGADFGIGKKGHFIPVVAEYGYIPGDNVKASAIYLRAGYGLPF